MLPVVPAARATAPHPDVLPDDRRDAQSGVRRAVTRAVPREGHIATLSETTSSTLHTSSSVAAWHVVLERYAAALEAQRSFLRAVSPTSQEQDADTEALVPVADVAMPAPFFPPVDMPPLPAELVSFVDALLAETAELVALTNEHVEATRPSVPLHAPRATASAGEATLDRKL